MLLPENFEEKLGFDKIRTMLRGMTLCPLGAQMVDEMPFLTDRTELQHQLYLLGEMQELMTRASKPLPTDSYFDLTPALKRIRLAGTFLETEELFDLMRSLRTIVALMRYLNPRPGEEIRIDDGMGGSANIDASSHFANLRALTEPLGGLDGNFLYIVQRIDQTLTPTGEIRDNASPQLAEIRHEMARNMSSIGRLLNSILRSAQSDGIVDKDTKPTMRDGRLVIPIPPSSKRKLKGIVHDESATGRTLYVEPAEVVEANNRIRELESDERQEIIRILTSLTTLVRPEVPNLMEAYSFLGIIDLLQAKVRFAQSIDGITPTLSEHNITDWVQARHPLLYIRYKRYNFTLPPGEQPKTVVPLDICLDHRKQRIVLISGPNAGGKSVCLETLGLVQYMLQHALPVPMLPNSQCAVFNNIFVDIGDDQSIDNDLSTYSSHLQNMKFILRHSQRGSLVLIDEFGSGTEPQIGGAIAQAILGKLNASQVNGVITTHFTNLKLFADQTPGIVNGAMLYDRGQMRPLFRLEVGRPGSSFAIEIANKIGLPLDVIEEAKRIVGSDYVNMDKYLQDISRDKRYWEQKREKIHQQEKDLERKSQEYTEKEAELKSRRQEVLQKARDEASALIRESNARIEKTIRDIKEAQAEKEATRRIRQEHARFVEQRIERKPKQEKKPEPEQNEKQSETTVQQPIAVGSCVRIKGQSTIGEVVEMRGRQCLVMFGMIRSNIDMSRLEAVSRRQMKKEGEDKFAYLATTVISSGDGKRSGSPVDMMAERRKTFKAELDVRGMRVDEAVQAVMYFLDDATLLSSGQVRILHGTGTGALRMAIRQYLSTCAHVADYRDEHVQLGGAGITVVELM